MTITIISNCIHILTFQAYMVSDDGFVSIESELIILNKFFFSYYVVNMIECLML